MPKTNSITQARLKELLDYDPETGDFTRLTNQASNARIGDVAGWLNPDGYIYISIDNIIYLAHRLVFMHMVDWMPEQVDHDNRIRHDNRWTNLNPSTQTGNMKNYPLRCDNTSGHCGVYWNKRLGKWQARIKVDGENIHLGTFTRKADAIAARQAAEIKYRFHPNHGKSVEKSLNSVTVQRHRL